MTMLPRLLSSSGSSQRRLALIVSSLFLVSGLIYLHSSKTSVPVERVPIFPPPVKDGIAAGNGSHGPRFHLWPAVGSKTGNFEPRESQESAPERARQSYAQVRKKVKELINSWDRPDDPEHWPNYQDYVNAEYDPNVWETFPDEYSLYTNGVKKLQQDWTFPRPYLPYPDYNSPAWSQTWKGTYVSCKGARGRRLNHSDEDIVKAWPMPLADFPEPVGGVASLNDVHLDSGSTHCFDRYNRYGPYGYDQNGWEMVSSWQRPISRPDWMNVRWGKLQDTCLLANKDRYTPAARQPVDLMFGKDMPKDDKDYHAANKQSPEGRVRQAKFHSRSAVLLRAYDSYEFSENDLQSMRAMITELSLLSGAEYHVFLLVEVKDKSANIFTDRQLHDEYLVNSVPREFRDITILWSEQMLEEWYPRVTNWSEFYQRFMALQWFSETHPEFDFVWNWEVDARYLGNYYQFFESVADFSRKMPRKHLWERNQRFYFPAQHGSFDNFLRDTDIDIEQAESSPVWGPRMYDSTHQEPLGPKPGHSSDTDRFTWGVNEEADLITFLPLFDPHNTEWAQKDKVWNYAKGVRVQFTHVDGLHDPDFADIPMKACINSLSRLSRRQLHAMHVENLRGRAMASEMFPATVALQHGLKAVYAPHAVWTDRKWPPWYLDAVFNADGNQSAQWSQQADSVWRHDREHNFWGWTFYYENALARSVYRRWLGWETKEPKWLGGVDGRKWEEEGISLPTEPDAEPRKLGGLGRMCLPPMLLHPVKDVKEDSI